MALEQRQEEMRARQKSPAQRKRTRITKQGTEPPKLPRILSEGEIFDELGSIRKAIQGREQRLEYLYDCIEEKQGVRFFRENEVKLVKKRIRFLKQRQNILRAMLESQ